MLLPDIRCEDDYRPHRWNAASWRPALRAICERHDLDPDGFARATDGTQVVWLSERVVIKLFVRIWAADVDRERAGLRAVEGSGLRVPRLLGEGELEGWPYLLLERLPGAQLKAVWTTLAPAEREDLAEQTGALLARLHRVPLERCGPPLVHDWSTFVAERLERVVAHHARHGAEPRWLEEVDAFLRAAPRRAVTPVLLHADVTHDHLLVAREGGRWRVTALIDWADAMTGDPLYELAVPSTMLPGSGPALLRGYGVDVDPDLLMFALLIHRWGDLASALRRAPAADLRDLRRSLWGR